jgi:predicted DNA-binding transcriptional regulator YafY
MTNIEIVDQPRVMLPDNEHFNIADYSKKVFNMFGGEEETVKLKFDNSLVNAVIDRFGKDVMLDKVDENSFSVRINVAISSTFFAWLTQFGNKVKILSPESVIEKYQNSIQEILEQYK